MINGEEREISFFTAFVDSDFISLLDMELLEGRNILSTETIGNRDYIINETAVKELGISNPIGMHAIVNGKDSIRIIGVVRDFHYANFHEPVQPMRLCYANYYSKVLVKFNPGNLQEILFDLERLAHKFEPDYQFDYDFLGELFMEAYSDERNMQTISNVLTIIAVFISCLGLYGLIMFLINQKFKEIGIRKVFGANSISLIFLLVNKLSRLVIISFFVAVPISYVLLEKWLESFAYRIEIPLFVYFFSFIILLSLVWITIGLQTMKAIRLNSVDVLKYE
jgi:putative ABC transport system permease protein